MLLMICATKSLEPNLNNFLNDSLENTLAGNHLTYQKLKITLNTANANNWTTKAHTPNPFNAAIIPKMPDIIADKSDIFDWVLKSTLITNLVLFTATNELIIRFRE